MSFYATYLYSKSLTMKNIFYLWGILFFLYSCGTNKTEEPEIPVQEVYMWQAGMNDSTGLLEMTKVMSSDIDSVSVPSVLSYFNTTNNNIKLDLVKISGDTIYLQITDAAYLTQQMGSAGPTTYIAGLVYNLTEIPGISYVNLDFEEGDHAQPGTYNRENFKDN